MTRIKFSKKERLAHPQARLIPEALWVLWGFSFGVNPLLLSFMQTSNEELMSRLGELNIFNNEDKEPTWIALMLSHPNLSHELIKNLTTQLKLSPEEELLFTCKWGNLSYFECLYSRDNPTNRIEEFFIEAATYGHVNIMQYLEQKVTEAELQILIEARTYDAFSEAASFGHLHVLKYLESKASKETLLKMIQGNNYLAYSYASMGGHIEVLEYMEEKAPQEVQEMIQAADYSAFRPAAERGHLVILNHLESKVSEEIVQKMIAADNYYAFRFAAARGHLAILEYLESKVSKEMFRIMIQSADYEAFRNAAENGHRTILEYLESKVSKKTLQEMIQADDYRAFSKAAGCGHLVILKYLESKVSEVIFQKMIEGESYNAFINAGGGEYLEILQYLESKVSKDVFQKMLKAHNYATYCICATRPPIGLQKAPSVVVPYLLQFPSVLGFAEAHEHEYATQIHPHIDGLLEALRTQKSEFENIHPQAVFNVSEEAAWRYFYCLRNLIRRGASIPRDELILLLNIPAVKAIVHTANNPHESNELLRLALNTQNRVAAELLLGIPAVHELAAANNYYRTESAGGLDARILAQDNESSMRGLTLGEQRRLSALLEHYKAELESKKIPTVIEELRTLLKARYMENPASTVVNLPFEWSEFEKLSLMEGERQLALQAYYQHKDHSALRYLSKPNYWMHAAAAYVNVNPDNTQERWSTFDEYQGLIALLYLAAKDEKTPGCDGFSVADRLRHFIEELALIGRAHNWDRTRKKGKHKEEYDDGQGDRPSCYSGVKRRLFQSVLGHPLMLILTTEKLKDELRIFARDHFKALITEDRRPLLKAAWDNVVGLEDLSEVEKTALKELDILPEQQKIFIDYLDNKYPDQFSTDPGFKYLIEKAFVLREANDSHACSSNFANTKWQQFLDSPELVMPEKIKLSSSLEQFLSLLDGLKRKQEYYLARHPEAYEQAQKIVNALESKARVFYANPNLEGVSDFKQECVDILNQNADVLRQHRDVFGAFFTAIQQFFVALQALLLNQPTRHRFFDNRTNGARVVDALVEDINGFSIEVSPS